MKTAIKQFITSLPERYKEFIPNFETVMQQMLVQTLKEMDLECVMDCLNIGAVMQKEEEEEI